MNTRIQWIPDQDNVKMSWIVSVLFLNHCSFTVIVARVAQSFADVLKVNAFFRHTLFPPAVAVGSCLSKFNIKTEVQKAFTKFFQHFWPDGYISSLTDLNLEFFGY